MNGRTWTDGRTDGRTWTDKNVHIHMKSYIWLYVNICAKVGFLADSFVTAEYTDLPTASFANVITVFQLLFIFRCILNQSFRILNVDTRLIYDITAHTCNESDPNGSQGFWIL